MVVAILGKKLDSILKVINDSIENVEVKTYKSILDLVNDINSNMLPKGIDRIVIRDNLLDSSGSYNEKQQTLLDLFDLLVEHFPSIRIISLSTDRENADIFEMSMSSVNAAHFWSGAGKVTATVISDMITKKIGDLKVHPFSVEIIRKKEQQAKIEAEKAQQVKVEQPINKQQEKGGNKSQDKDNKSNKPVKEKKGFGLFGGFGKKKEVEVNKVEQTPTSEIKEDTWGDFGEEETDSFEPSSNNTNVEQTSEEDEWSAFVGFDESQEDEVKVDINKHTEESNVKETNFEEPIKVDITKESEQPIAKIVRNEGLQEEEVDFGSMFEDIDDEEDETETTDDEYTEIVEDTRDFINNRSDEADTTSMLKKAGISEESEKVKVSKPSEIIEEEVDFSSLVEEDIDLASEEQEYRREAASQVKEVIKEVEVVKEVVKEVIKEVPAKQKKYNRFVEMTMGKEKGVLIFTGDRRQGITINALTLALEMKKKNPKLKLLYVDFDAKRRGSLPYLGITDILAEPDNIRMGLAGIKKPSHVQHFAYKPVNGYDFPCLISFYGIALPEKQLEVADECIANQTDFDVVIIDCPLENLRYLDSNLMDADLVFVCDNDANAVINLLELLNNLQIPNRVRSKMLNRGGFLINRKNSKESFSALLKDVNNLFDMSEYPVNWTELKVLGESKELLKAMMKI